MIGRGGGSHPPSDRPSSERGGGEPIADDTGVGDGTSRNVGDTDTTQAMCSEWLGPKCCYASVSVKLGTYDGSTCVEAFLANVKKFVAFLQWDEETKLFHLCMSLRGLAGQLLWDLGLDVTLVELTCLLRKWFGTMDQAERFRAELQTQRCKAAEAALCSARSLYNDICCHVIGISRSIVGQSVAVTENEFILGIDILSEQCCVWNFGRSHIILAEDSIPLRKDSAANEC